MAEIWLEIVVKRQFVCIFFFTHPLAKLWNDAIVCDLKLSFRKIPFSNFSFPHELMLHGFSNLDLKKKNLIGKLNICISFLPGAQFYCVLKKYFCCCKSCHRVYKHKDFLGFFRVIYFYINNCYMISQLHLGILKILCCICNIWMASFLPVFLEFV